jgi:dihydroflavonol-4-reductase
MTHSINSHSINSHSINSHSINSHSINSHSINSHSINSHSGHSHSINSHSGPTSVPRQGADRAAPPASLARVLITGGTGFIGRNLLNRLSRSECEVRVAVRPGGRSRLPVSSGMQIHECSMRRTEDWLPLVDGVDTVIHMVGATAGTRDELLHVNRDITLGLARASSQVSNSPRLIYVSSLSAAGPSRRFEPRCPWDPSQPISDYGRSKYEGELAALSVANRAPTIILRPGIVFGPGDKELVRLLDPIARMGINPMAGFHDPRIAFVHVEDLIDAILAAAVHGRACQGSEPHDHAGLGVYFVADPEFITFSQFAHFAASGLRRERVWDLRMPLGMVHSVAWANELAGRLFGRRSTFNPDKIREASCAEWTCNVKSTEKELGWSPAFRLEQRVHQFASMYTSK